MGFLGKWYLPEASSLLKTVAPASCVRLLPPLLNPPLLPLILLPLPSEVRASNSGLWVLQLVLLKVKLTTGTSSAMLDEYFCEYIDDRQITEALILSLTLPDGNTRSVVSPTVTPLVFMHMICYNQHVSCGKNEVS